LLGWIALRSSEIRTAEKYKPFGGGQVPAPWRASLSLKG
jgi:hypothetical protein